MVIHAQPCIVINSDRPKIDVARGLQVNSINCNTDKSVDDWETRGAPANTDTEQTGIMKLQYVTSLLLVLGLLSQTCLAQFRDDHHHHDRRRSFSSRLGDGLGVLGAALAAGAITNMVMRPRHRLPMAPMYPAFGGMPYQQPFMSGMGYQPMMQRYPQYSPYMF